MLHKKEDVYPVILQAKHKSLYDGSSIAVVIFFGVHLQPPLRVCLLFLGQPLGVLGEIRNDEDARDGEENRDATVDDE